MSGILDQGFLDDAMLGNDFFDETKPESGRNESHPYDALSDSSAFGKDPDQVNTSLSQTEREDWSVRLSAINLPRITNL